MSTFFQSTRLGVRLLIRVIFVYLLFVGVLAGVAVLFPGSFSGKSAFLADSGLLMLLALVPTAPLRDAALRRRGWGRLCLRPLWLRRTRQRQWLGRTPLGPR